MPPPLVYFVPVGPVAVLVYEISVCNHVTPVDYVVRLSVFFFSDGYKISRRDLQSRLLSYAVLLYERCLLFTIWEM
jgi:hypothetical protein